MQIDDTPLLRSRYSKDAIRGAIITTGKVSHAQGVSILS